MTHPLARGTVIERKTRILCVASYFGLAPLLWLSGVAYQHNRSLKHHTQHSLAFSFILLCFLGVDLITDRIQYWFMTDLWKPTMAEFNLVALPMYTLSQFIAFGCVLFAVWIVISWFVSTVGAWRGKTPSIPGISWVASQFQMIRIAVYWSLLVQLAFALLIGLIFQSIQLAKSLPSSGDVYVLYTQGGYIPIDGLYQTYTPPQWAVTLAFYPLVHAAMEKYGVDSVTVLPLSEASFNEALHTGRFIFVASHGGYSPGAFTISNQPYKEFAPADVSAANVGEQLEFAYFAGCWTGTLESDWRQVLGLDDAIMFDRLSYVEEHMLWVWFKSPAVIRGLN